MSDTDFSPCRLCPRNCGALRTEGQSGVCGVTDTLRLARAALHYWEEPCISGVHGSGAVFFSGCNLRCVFCQNRDIALGRAGVDITPHRLTEIFLELEAQGAHNINLVTACHYIPIVAECLKEAKRQGLSIPVVYNSGGYESVEGLRHLEGLIDVYLPDMKYMDAELAAAYSRAPDYPEKAQAAVAEMVRQTAQEGCLFDEDGMIRRGVIVRHLLLPGHVKNAKAVADYLYSTYGEKIYLSLMSQYTPMEALRDDPLLGRTVTKREYQRLLGYCLELGITNAYIQEGEAAKESFIPAFNAEGVLPGAR